MNLRRVGILFMKDLIYGSRNIIFVIAIILPLVLSLVLGLLFGTIFSEKPKLGITDASSSQLATELGASDFMIVERYDSQDGLMAALETGAVEIGLALPANFDADLLSGATTDVTLYIWGQSLVKNRTIILAAVTEELVNLTGRETPIAIDAVLVGDRASLSWQQRLLPLIVLMSVMIGGIMVPAISMVEEKQARTLRALTVTPMSMGEVFLTKGLMGVLLSVFSGVAILTLNGGWGPSPALLLVVLALGGTLAAAFGVLLGSRVKDIHTLFAVIKAMGILLYAPGLIALFPDSIPQWIARLFPTYYVMQPVMDISQRGAGLGDIAFDVIILAVITAALIAALGVTADRLQVQEA
ncbi:MAG: ABC transporter permease [Anaerolineae bacterium]|nr:ABC transporter permease [Anaerolineae bacterium]